MTEVMNPTRPCRTALLAAVAATALAGASQAAAPKMQTFEPRGLAIRFALPSDWSPNASYREKDVRFQSQAPAHVAELKIGTFPASSASSTTIRRLVGTLRASILQTDPGASVATRTTRVGSAPALELSARFRGAGSVAMGPNDRLAFDLYVVEHHDVVYLLEYQTTVRWLAKEKPIFVASIRSLRFVHTA
jgi:hypothetical protein